MLNCRQNLSIKTRESLNYIYLHRKRNGYPNKLTWQISVDSDCANDGCCALSEHRRCEFAKAVIHRCAGRIRKCRVSTNWIAVPFSSYNITTGCFFCVNYMWLYLSLSIIFNRGISLFKIILSGNIISCTNSAAHVKSPICSAP